MNVLKIFIDGGSRGNPGQSGIGVYGYYQENNTSRHIVLEEAQYLGKQTNNIAEYCALIHALYCVQQNGLSGPIRVYTDSQLLQKQIIGAYKVKTPHIRQLYSAVMEMKQEQPFYIEHVLRAYNKEADALANKGIDARTTIPSHLSALLESLTLV